MKKTNYNLVIVFSGHPTQGRVVPQFSGFYFVNDIEFTDRKDSLARKYLVMRIFKVQTTDAVSWSKVVTLARTTMQERFPGAQFEIPLLGSWNMWRHTTG